MFKKNHIIQIMKISLANIYLKKVWFRNGWSCQLLANSSFNTKSTQFPVQILFSFGRLMIDVCRNLSCAYNWLSMNDIAHKVGRQLRKQIWANQAKRCQSLTMNFDVRSSITNQDNVATIRGSKVSEQNLLWESELEAKIELNLTAKNILPQISVWCNLSSAEKTGNWKLRVLNWDPRVVHKVLIGNWSSRGTITVLLIWLRLCSPADMAKRLIARRMTCFNVAILRYGYSLVNWIWRTQRMFDNHEDWTLKENKSLFTHFRDFGCLNINKN